MANGDDGFGLRDTLPASLPLNQFEDDGLGLRDPLPAFAHLGDFEVDVLNIWDDIPGGLGGADPVPAPAAAAAAAAAPHDADQVAAPDHSLSGDHLDMDWPTMPDNYFIGDDDIFGPSDAPIGLPAHDGGAPSTSAVQEANVLDCSGCHVLREILHSNGMESTKLCIHGDVGVFYHATLDIYRINSDGQLQDPTLTHQSWIDFRSRDYGWVKQYLTEYAQLRAAANFAVVQDSLAPFHDILCTTMNDDGHELRAAAAATDGGGGGGGQLVYVDVDAAPTEISPPSGGMDADPSSSAVDVQPPQHPAPTRSALALQRERTRTLQLQDMAPHFHLPMLEAAEKLGVCSTVLKGVCRRVGIRRWPYRKVKKIDGQIAKLRRSGDGAWERSQIEKLIVEKRSIFDGLE